LCADVELVVQARKVLLHRSFRDDELSGDRPGGRRLGERVARQQRPTQGEEHIALAWRERRRLCDRGRLRPSGRTVEQRTESPENDLVTRVQGSLADDPSSVHEGPVARAEVADSPRVAESLEYGMHPGDPIRVDAQTSNGASLAPDRMAVAIGGGDGIAIWDFDPDHLAAAACRLAGRNLTATEWDTHLAELGAHRPTCPENS
jgi:hypothetical protein